jgi:ABC-type multidrug transport system fused ATPase/permease subunit
MPLFGQVFQRYDALNASVQENVTAIRVVKAFVREDHEDKKFAHAANEVHDLFVKAESLLAFNNPIMGVAIYGCIIALSWFGTHSILAGEISTGQLTSLLGYVFNVLISLMMLTMIFVMVSMSAASGQRIAEVLDEEPDIVSPKDALMDVPNGSVDFESVSFSYRGADGEGEQTLAGVGILGVGSCPGDSPVGGAGKKPVEQRPLTALHLSADPAPGGQTVAHSAEKAADGGRYSEPEKESKPRRSGDIDKRDCCDLQCLDRQAKQNDCGKNGCCQDCSDQ